MNQCGVYFPEIRKIYIYKEHGTNGHVFVNYKYTYEILITKDIIDNINNSIVCSVITDKVFIRKEKIKKLIKYGVFSKE